MAAFRDTVPMNDTSVHDTFEDLNKTIQDNLFESMAEFMRRTAPKDADSEKEVRTEDEQTKDVITRDHLYESMEEFMERTSIKDTAVSEIPRKDDRMKDIETDFAKDFGFSETDFLLKKFDYEKETLDNAEDLRDAEYREEYIKFTDEKYTKGGISNCYGFASDWYVHPVTGEPFKEKPQPGEIAGCPLTCYEFDNLCTYGSHEEIKENLLARIKMDYERDSKDLIEVDSNDYIPKDGERMIALMYGGGDYHFMRKGEYGYWYHKPGVLTPTRFDDSGKPITDPATCDRGIYDHFCGYFIIREKED